MNTFFSLWVFNVSLGGKNWKFMNFLVKYTRNLQVKRHHPPLLPALGGGKVILNSRKTKETPRCLSGAGLV